MRTKKVLAACAVALPLALTSCFGAHSAKADTVQLWSECGGTFSGGGALCSVLPSSPTPALPATVSVSASVEPLGWMGGGGSTIVPAYVEVLVNGIVACSAEEPYTTSCTGTVLVPDNQWAQCQVDAYIGGTPAQGVYACQADPPYVP
jgi:hypothetical protein